MRTTLDIDEPVLLVIRSLAAQTGKSMGRIASELMAKALARDEAGTTRNGLPVFAAATAPGPATVEWVNELRDGDTR